MWRAINESLSGFCSSSVLWDTDLTWNSAHPEFTECFERTILNWLPCIFLWLSLPLSVYSFRRSKTPAIPFNRYNRFKLVTIVILAAATLLDIANYVFIGREQVLIQVYTLVVKFLTICVFFGLTYTSLKCGVASSGYLFVFSLLLVLCGAPQFRTALRSRGSLFKFASAEWNEAERGEIVEFLFYFVYYLASWVTFCLNCFADKRPRARDDAYVCPENDSSVLSRMFFCWFGSFAWKGYRHTLDYEDVWDVDDELKTAHISSRFESRLNRAFGRLKKNAKVRYVNGKSPNLETSSSYEATSDDPREKVSIFRPLVETFGSYISLALFVKLVHISLSFASPQLLSLTLDFVGNKEEASWHGFVYAILFLILAILESTSVNLCGTIMSRNGIAIRAALMSVIYKKALKISNGARTDFTVGEMVNLMSVDTERLFRLMYSITVMWSAPFEICLAMFYLWRILGPCVLAGVVVLITFISINYVIGAKVQRQQIQQMKYKDERVKLTTEILSGIKVLKLNAWEASFEKQVALIREKEIAVLKKTSYIESGSTFVWAIAPFLVSLVTFAVYVLSSEKHVLTAQTAFVSLSLFNLLKSPLSMIPMVITNMTQAAVSIKRINRFLNSEDLDPNAVQHEERSEPIIIENGHFSWNSYDGTSVLSDINLRVRPGSLVAVVGPVGVGKSSLLSAVLGEMYKQSGIVNTTGTLAYVPQQAWMRNATFKDNVTLGETPNHSLYAGVLAACALKADLKILPGGDSAEIGEKGVNLSGGQKQRISLARAVYSDADTYLLDDPLSAVDSNVGKHIFEQVIGPNGLLKNKTRVWVTHNLTYLSQVDFVVVLKNGVISESGTYHQLLDSKGDFANHLSTYMNESAEEDVEEDSRQPAVPESTEQQPVPNEQKTIVEVTGQKLIEAEKAAVGTVNWSVYLYYLKVVGPLSLAISLCMNVSYQVFSVASNFWLSVWSSDTSKSVDKQYMYLGVYALFGFSNALSVMIQAIALFAGTLKAANSIHNRLLVSVLHWPTIAFDKIPLGRIINRFGPDMDTLDSVLPSTLGQILVHTATITSTMFVISYSIPMFVYAILPIGALYYFLQRFYVVTSRQLKRFQSISKSPIYSHMGETVTGAQSIRAYGVQPKFIKMLENKIDYNQRSTYACSIADRWLAVRLEMVGGTTTFFSVIFAVYARNTLSAGIVGLAVSYAMQITSKLYVWLRTVSQTETNVVAIERIKEYEDEKQEAPWQVTGENLPVDWPNKGEVVFEDFQTRYRDDLEPVLKGISFNVTSGEKVGVVGRTGAGKSSLTLSLFRLIEPTGGRILIDGVDITKIGLHTLRSHLTIIPQDPVLFSGTLKINLDPANAHSDEKLWRALELANLKTFVSSLNFGLQSQVTEGGSNFSVGQRQLICLARAVLRKTKLLILDEATAAVDMETDDFIQSTIRKEFEDCTVLTIAHRLNTVMDYDRILVLDNGRIAEFDSPKVLLQSKESTFYTMVSDAGLTSAAHDHCERILK